MPWFWQASPRGGYRGRTEAELYDHLETQCRALMEAGKSETKAQAETLRAMGEPKKLRDAYRAAWKRSLSGRLEVLACCLRTWFLGLAVIFGVQLLISTVAFHMWEMAISLPGDSYDPQIRMIRNIAMDYHNSYTSLWFPFVLALIVLQNPNAAPPGMANQRGAVFLLVAHHCIPCLVGGDG